MGYRAQGAVGIRFPSRDHGVIGGEGARHYLWLNGDKRPSPLTSFICRAVLPVSSAGLSAGFVCQELRGIKANLMGLNGTTTLFTCSSTNAAS